MTQRNPVEVHISRHTDLNNVSAIAHQILKGIPVDARAICIRLPADAVWNQKELGSVILREKRKGSATMVHTDGTFAMHTRMTSIQRAIRVVAPLLVTQGDEILTMDQRDIVSIISANDPRATVIIFTAASVRELIRQGKWSEEMNIFHECHVSLPTPIAHADERHLAFAEG